MIATRSRSRGQGPARLRRARRRGEGSGAACATARSPRTSRSAASPPRASRSRRRRFPCSSRSTSRSAAGSSAPCARSSASTRPASRCPRAMRVTGRALAEPVARRGGRPAACARSPSSASRSPTRSTASGEQALERVRVRARKLSPRLIQHQFSYYTEINLLIALGRTKEARVAPRGARRRSPPGEVLKLSHWIAQMHLCRRGAPRPREPSTGRNRRRRAPRSHAQGPVDDGRRAICCCSARGATRIAASTTTRSSRTARRRSARASSASTSRCQARASGSPSTARSHPDVDQPESKKTEASPGEQASSSPRWSSARMSV